jgi:hypothetical protein
MRVRALVSCYVDGQRRRQGDEFEYTPVGVNRDRHPSGLPECLERVSTPEPPPEKSGKKTATE